MPRPSKALPTTPASVLISMLRKTHQFEQLAELLDISIPQLKRLSSGSQPGASERHFLRLCSLLSVPSRDLPGLFALNAVARLHQRDRTLIPAMVEPACIDLPTVRLPQSEWAEFLLLNARERALMLAGPRVEESLQLALTAAYKGDVSLPVRIRVAWEMMTPLGLRSALCSVGLSDRDREPERGGVYLVQPTSEPAHVVVAEKRTSRSKGLITFQCRHDHQALCYAAVEPSRNISALVLGRLVEVQQLSLATS